MSIFDDIRKDKEAGTPGGWGLTRPMDGYENVRGGSDGIMEHICSMSHYRDERKAERAPNARRITRVPQLEEIALAVSDALELAEAGMIDDAFDHLLRKISEAAE